MLPKNSALRLQDVSDGLSNTIAVFESGGRPYLYRRPGPTQVSDDLSNVRVNGGGWVRPASDILFSGSSKDGLQIPGAFVNRTDGLDIGGEILLIFGTKDPHTPQPGRETIRAGLDAAGTRYIWSEYGAEHAFGRDVGHRYDPEATDRAFAETTTFFRRLL